MQCQSCQALITEYVDETLTTDMEARVREHLAQCADCRIELEFQRMIRSHLRDLPVPAMRPQFKDELSAKLRPKTQWQWPQWGFGAGFGAALALCSVVFLAASLWILPVQQDRVPDVMLSVNETVPVTLSFDSPQAFTEVEFSVELPEHFQIVGAPQQRYFRWTAGLNKGTNVLTLPITATRAYRGELVARISSASSSKIFRIKLNSVQPDVSAMRLGNNDAKV